MDRPNLREARLGSNSRPSGAFAFRQDQRGGGFGASERYGYGGGYYGYGGGYRRRDFDYPGGGLDKVTQKVVAFGGLTRAVGWSADGVGQAGGAIRGIPDTYNGAYQQRRAYGEYSERVADRYDDRGQSRGYAPQGGGYAQGGGSQQTSFDRTDPRYYDYDGDGNLGRGDEFKDFARANPELAARYSGNGRKLDRNEFAQLLLDRERFLAERQLQQAGQGAAQSAQTPNPYAASSAPAPTFVGDGTTVNIGEGAITKDNLAQVLSASTVMINGTQAGTLRTVNTGDRLNRVLQAAIDGLKDTPPDTALLQELQKPENQKKLGALFDASDDKQGNIALTKRLLEQAQEVARNRLSDPNLSAEEKTQLEKELGRYDKQLKDINEAAQKVENGQEVSGDNIFMQLIKFIASLLGFNLDDKKEPERAAAEPAASASAAAPAAAPAKAPEAEKPAARTVDDPYALRVAEITDFAESSEAPGVSKAGVALDVLVAAAIGNEKADGKMSQDPNSAEAKAYAQIFELYDADGSKQLSQAELQKLQADINKFKQNHPDKFTVDFMYDEVGIQKPAAAKQEEAQGKTP